MRDMSATGPLEIIEVAAKLYRLVEDSPKSRHAKFAATLAKDMIESRPRMAYIQSMSGSARAGFDDAAYKLLESALSFYKWSGGE